MMASSGRPVEGRAVAVLIAEPTSEAADEVSNVVFHAWNVTL